MKDCMVGIAYCGVTVELSGWALNNVYAFRELLTEVSLVKITKDND